MDTADNWVTFLGFATNMQNAAAGANIVQIICAGQDCRQNNPATGESWTNVMTALFPGTPLAFVVPNRQADVLVHPMISTLLVRRPRQANTGVSVSFTACLARIIHNVVI